MNNELKIPELSLVVLIGCSGSGKSYFAKKLFKPTEIISSDYCRALVSDDENDQKATKDAFEVLNFVVSKRLKNGLLTVIDATNVQPESRKPLISLAKEFHCLPVAIVLNVPEKICKERNAVRTDRNIPEYVLRQQQSQLKRSIKKLKREGFRQVYVLDSDKSINMVDSIKREKLYNDKRELAGPFDIIGDVHGCYEELKELLHKLGYVFDQTEYDLNYFGIKVSHPEKRQVIFLGDLVDRGPDSPSVLKLVMSMVNSGIAYCVPGNHDMKLQKYLNGKNVQISHGLEKTVEQLKNESEEFHISVKEFLYGMISHYVFDDGNLVVAHAGLKEEMQGRGSGAVRNFCYFGETTGETDEFGLPVRYNWAREYRGKAKVVYGHTPVLEPQWLNKTINIDTGCVFGEELTALQYPEEKLVSVAAKETYSNPARPIISSNETLSHQHEYDDVLEIEDVIGKRIIQTRLRSNLTIREEQSFAALEVLSRFAVNPKWLIYLPPTMSPSETSELSDYLEHPKESFNYYKNRGVKTIICEEKHMGSRAILIVCKDKQTVKARFGIEEDTLGKCFTRTGRNFFNDLQIEKDFIHEVRESLLLSGFWEKFETDWVCLDAELMPWSLKAQALLKDQYAAVGASASIALKKVTSSLENTASRQIEGVEALLDRFKEKEEMITKYKNAYRHYCWPVNGIKDLKLAPFHILATEGKCYSQNNHEWHMNSIKEISMLSKGLIIETPYKLVDLNNEKQIEEAIDWWTDLTSTGGEGMVVKPIDFIAYGEKELLQPAIKCRGKEYLRIIYGPEYSTQENMKMLKSRSLGKKRSLAIREFALGIEALERFVRKEPLRAVHECVFGVLALESDMVDPRL